MIKPQMAENRPYPKAHFLSLQCKSLFPMAGESLLKDWLFIYSDLKPPYRERLYVEIEGPRKPELRTEGERGIDLVRPRGAAAEIIRYSCEYFYPFPPEARRDGRRTINLQVEIMLSSRRFP